MIAPPPLVSTALGLAVLLSLSSASALTVEERWRAEDLKWRRISASVCVECGRPQRAKTYAVLVDPIAVLERKPSPTSRTLDLRRAGTVVTARVTDRTLVPRYRKRAISYAQLLKRRRLAKILQARRYAAVISRRRAQAAATQAAAAQAALAQAAAAQAAAQAAASQAAARAATVSNEVELGTLRWESE